MKRLLCIRLPSWPIQRLVVAQPELNGRVIILHARDPRRGQCVVACSRAAYRGGIRPHMPLAEAASLHEHEQPATATAPYIAEHNPQADAEVLEQLAQWCECFSPLVGFEILELQHGGSSQPRRTDCLYLDVTNLAPYFGSEDRLARLVAESFSQRGYLVRVAIADTLGAAWALAHFARQEATLLSSPGDRSASTGFPATGFPATGFPATGFPATGPTTAIPASSFLVVPPGATLTALHPLPIEALRLPQNIESLLQQLGIFQIAQLACLPREGLLARFGTVVLKRWDQACGHVNEVLLVHHPAPQFQTDWVLEHPTTNHKSLQSILETLTDRLTTTLLRRGEGVIQCSCHLACETKEAEETEEVEGASTHLTNHLSHIQPQSSPHHRLTLRIGLFQPTACAKHLRQLLQMQLERLLLPGPVERIVLEASLTAPLERRQRELFSDAMRHTSHHLAFLVDRLSSRLGSTNVVEARLHSDAQPEFAYRYLPLTGSLRPRRPAAHRSSRSRVKQRNSGRKKSAATRSTVRHRLIRPLQLRSPPLPLAVIAIGPDGPPAKLLFGKRAYRVARYWGPERIETGWWRGRSVRRDYYRLETQSGHWLWVFRQLADGNWFLHGTFG